MSGRFAGFDRRYASWLVLLAVLLAAPLFAGFSHVGWEAAQLAGLAGAVGCTLLCGAPLRPRASTPPKLVTLRVHSLVGWSALFGTVLHVAGVLRADRTAFEYLRPSMPAFQLAGIVAGVLLVGVTVSAIAGVRRAIWTGHRGFQACHVALSCCLLITLTVHVVTTDRYAGGGVRRALYVAAVAGAVLMLLRPRVQAAVATAAPPSPPGDAAAGELSGNWFQRWRRHLVFGRHSTVITVVIISTVIVLSGLFVGAARGALREPLAKRLEPLPLNFPHGKHVQVNCLTCHHNFADGTGMENCVLCHKSERTDLKEGVQARFHEFCLTCHRRPPAGLHGRGPVSECQDCHRAEGTAHP